MDESHYSHVQPSTYNPSTLESIREPASVPLLISPQSVDQDLIRDQPLETDFPATDAPPEHRAQPLEADLGSRCSMRSTSVAASPAVYVHGCKISYEMTPFSSTLSALHPMCRICQNPSEKKNVLITPCRCDGSLKHVHGTCLRVSTV